MTEQGGNREIFGRIRGTAIVDFGDSRRCKRNCKHGQDAHTLPLGISTRLPAGQSYRELMCKELEGTVDGSRIHFLGKVPYQKYLSVLRVSRVHVYLTMPFVLSWSVLEAMSAGCLVVASKTPPVEEAIEHGRSGLLFHFFSHDELAGLVEKALSSAGRYDVIRKAARESVIERFDLRRKALAAQIGMIGAIAGRSVIHRTVAAA